VGGTCGSRGRGIYRVLGGKPESNIKMDLREIAINGAIWIRLAQDKVQWRAFVDTIMNLRVP
jgi:hypothetical protein